MPEFIEITSKVATNAEPRKTTLNTSDIIFIDENKDGTADITVKIEALTFYKFWRTLTITTLEPYSEITAKLNKI